MRVVVGRVGRPHGIRGEVTVEVRTDDPDIRFADGATLLTQDGAVVVESAHWHSGRLLVAFDGIEDRNGAEALRGTLLEVERDADEVPADPDEYYDDALVGCVAEFADGVAIGSVTDVLHLPGQDLLVLDVDGREVLVPFVASVVPEVDIAGRRVVITPPDGLLDLGAS